VRIDVINIILSCKYILYIEVAHTNCFTGSLNIYIGKTSALGFGILFIYLFINKKIYYNSSLFLNKSIYLINIGL